MTGELSFYVAKISDYNMNITTSDIAVGENATITVNVPKDANGHVKITIDGIEYNTTIKEGVASVNIADLTVGKHTIIVTYNGHDKYTNNYATSIINVSKIFNYNIDISVPTDVKAGEKAIINVTLPNDAKGIVTVKIGDKTYDVVVKNGRVTITTDELATSNYDVNATYNGDNKYDAKNSNKKDIIVPKVSDYNMTIIIPDSVKTGENVTIFVNLPSDAIGSVTVTVDGKNYAGAVINGFVKVTIPPLSQGEHNITTTYSGDDQYDFILKILL